LIGEGFERLGELARTGIAWGEVEVSGVLGVDVDTDVGASPVLTFSFSSFFFFPNSVSIPMTVKRVQMGSRLVSWTSIRSTHT
jgi:hypothetical protein